MHEGQSRASLCRMFCAEGTGEPQMVNRRGASHCQSPVPVNRVLGGHPINPILGGQWRSIDQLREDHSNSVAVELWLT